MSLLDKTEAHVDDVLDLIENMMKRWTSLANAGQQSDDSEMWRIYLFAKILNDLAYIAECNRKT